MVTTVEVDDDGYCNSGFRGRDCYDKNRGENAIEFLRYRYLLKTTKLILTLFKINSIAISIVIMFRLVNKPYMPIKNKAVLTNRICDIGTPVIRPPLYPHVMEFVEFHYLFQISL